MPALEHRQPSQDREQLDEVEVGVDTALTLAVEGTRHYQSSARRKFPSAMWTSAAAALLMIFAPVAAGLAVLPPRLVAIHPAVGLARASASEASAAALGAEPCATRRPRTRTVFAVAAAAGADDELFLELELVQLVIELLGKESDERDSSIEAAVRAWSVDARPQKSAALTLAIEARVALVQAEARALHEAGADYTAQRNQMQALIDMMAST